MQPLLPSSDLGRNLLIVIDNCPECLAVLRTAISRMTDVPCRFFTLLHCSPTTYWEHGAGSDLELQHELAIRRGIEDREMKLPAASGRGILVDTFPYAPQAAGNLPAND